MKRNYSRKILLWKVKLGYECNIYVCVIIPGDDCDNVDVIFVLVPLSLPINHMFVLVKVTFDYFVVLSLWDGW